ncbi:hypothetical protein, variant 2 [Exophiala mesophila]|uniref:Ribonuclease H n=1 Tax=Exophiala mesophila TaxID=212818 RepID=A0A0D1XWL2_EXOME|nr:hypothetical protein, variant 1 [Exophiala mesophila]XP_016224160.1 hypothetical protein, variant 2 [Exophiala mesophila]KIV92585.1 hypothetical protein, variant 1 [Exophiala mesophila]KIV92586.1 hypothetical protein, variant 2 [Exophiala mesophila]
MAQSALGSRANDPSRSSPSLTSTNAVAGIKRKRPAERKFYAVKDGKKPGIYDTWDQCLSQVRGHKGAVFKAFPSLHEAQAFMDGKLVKSTDPNGEQKFYAVQNGLVPGVYTAWHEAQAQIRGVRKPKHKKFNTRAEAEAFVAAGQKTNGFGDAQNASPGEEIRRLIVRNSAPGLHMNGTYSPIDKDGTPYEIGRGPLPAGAEDGFDPNIKLSADGTIVNRTEEEKERTKIVPKDRDPPGMLRIYTDGSSLKNGQVGARAGVGVYFGPQDPKNVSEALKGSKQTNQRAELTAILRALEIAPRHREVTIYTDSKYSIDCVTNWYKNWQRRNWTTADRKPVVNKDVIMEIREKIEERESLKRNTYFVWVKGHANDPGNIAADQLAVAGAMSGRGIQDDIEPLTDVEPSEHGEHEDDGNSAIRADMRRAVEFDSDDEFKGA